MKKVSKIITILFIAFLTFVILGNSIYAVDLTTSK